MRQQKKRTLQALSGMAIRNFDGETDPGKTSLTYFMAARMKLHKRNVIHYAVDQADSGLVPRMIGFLTTPGGHGVWAPPTEIAGFK
eukprot:6596175-Pyramimonas_sp.AAC.1